MINLEQVRLLETRVAKAIDCIERLSGENTALNKQEKESRKKLETYQKRIDELEVLVKRFKEDQSQIEDTFFATLDRLNQFEDAMEKCLGAGTSPKAAVTQGLSAKAAKSAAAKPSQQPLMTAVKDSGNAVNEKICFEISSGKPDGELNDTPANGLSDESDIADPLSGTASGLSADNNEELQIY